MSPTEFFAPSSLLRVRSWLHPFQGNCEHEAMRDEWVIYVAGHPLLNRRCTRLAGCIRLRNDWYCVRSGIVKFYLLTHSPVWGRRGAGFWNCTRARSNHATPL